LCGRSHCHLLFDTLDLKQGLLLLALPFYLTVEITDYIVKIKRFLADAKRVSGGFLHFKNRANIIVFKIFKFQNNTLPIICFIKLFLD